MDLRLTKKDCLVVFVCGIFLLMTLGAAGAGSRERARRILCRANLHQWYAAVKGFADDNDGKLMISTPYGYDQGANKLTSIFPNEMNLDSYATSQGTGTGIDQLANQGFPEPHSVISHEALWPYLKGFNDQNLRFADIIVLPPISPGPSYEENFRLRNAWSCPSNNISDFADMMSRIQIRAYFRLQYAYFARSELWESSIATEPEDITTNNFQADKLLMADSVFYWSPSDFWTYNHGKYGASDHDLNQTFGQPIDAMTGINKLFGDGHTEWKNESEFDPQLLTIPQAAQPRINNGFGAYMYY